MATGLWRLSTFQKQQYAVLRKLSELNVAQFDELLKGLNEIQASLSVEKFSKRLSEKVKTIPEDVISDFVTLLCGLYPAKENNDKTSSQIASDIKETAEDEKPDVFPPEKAAILKSRMEKLLSVDRAIAVTAKAFDVVTEHQRIFCGSRIFSDIRPVFSASADSVSAAVILHTLNISYHDGGNHKEFYVVLENTELEDLKEAIERAEKKAKTLQSIIQKTGITYLEEGD